MFERIPPDAKAHEAGLDLNDFDERVTGELPASFNAQDIFMARFVKTAAASVDERFDLEFDAGMKERADPNALLALWCGTRVAVVRTV